jgi:hypothetical protein
VKRARAPTGKYVLVSGGDVAFGAGSTPAQARADAKHRFVENGLASEPILMLEIHPCSAELYRRMRAFPPDRYLAFPCRIVRGIAVPGRKPSALPHIRAQIGRAKRALSRPDLSFTVVLSDNEAGLWHNALEKYLRALEREIANEPAPPSGMGEASKSVDRIRTELYQRIGTPRGTFSQDALLEMAAAGEFTIYAYVTDSSVMGVGLTPRLALYDMGRRSPELHYDGPRMRAYPCSPEFARQLLNRRPSRWRIRPDYRLENGVAVPARRTKASTDDGARDDHVTHVPRRAKLTFTVTLSDDEVRLLEDALSNYLRTLEQRFASGAFERSWLERMSRRIDLARARLYERIETPQGTFGGTFGRGALDKMASAGDFTMFVAVSDEWSVEGMGLTPILARADANRRRNSFVSWHGPMFATYPCSVTLYRQLAACAEEEIVWFPCRIEDGVAVTERDPKYPPWTALRKRAAKRPLLRQRSLPLLRKPPTNWMQYRPRKS